MRDRIVLGPSHFIYPSYSAYKLVQIVNLSKAVLPLQLAFKLCKVAYEENNLVPQMALEVRMRQTSLAQHGVVRRDGSMRGGMSRAAVITVRTVSTACLLLSESSILGVNHYCIPCSVEGAVRCETGSTENGEIAK